MGVLNGAKEQLKWGNLKYLGGYPNKTIPFICGLYKEDGKIELHGGSTWQLQFSILKENILNLEIRNDKILMKIKYEDAEIELQFTAPNTQLAYNKMTTAIYQDKDTPLVNKATEPKKDNITDNQIKFYEKTWFMWAALFFFAPLGIFLMWKYNRFSKNARKVASVVFGIFFLVMVVSYVSGNKDSDKKEVATKSTKSVETKKEVAVEKKEKTPEEIKKEADEKAAKDAEDAKKAEQKKYKEWVKNQFSVSNGSHIALVDLIKENLNDKKSFQHDKTTYTDNGDSLTIYMRYRAKNAFGGTILQNVTATADYKTNTIKIISQND